MRDAPHPRTAASRAPVRAASTGQSRHAGPWYARPLIDVFGPLRRGNRVAGERMGATGAVKVTLGVSIALMIIVGALTLTRSPPRVVRVSASSNDTLGTAVADIEVCQASEVLPAGVPAIRLAVGAYYGARVRVKAYSGSRVIMEGKRGANWTGNSVTVPVTPLSHTTSHVKLCVEVGPNSELVYFSGSPASAQESAVSRGGEPLGGRMGIEYLAPGRGSWWSRILPVARHIGLGHVVSGTWIVLLIAALMAAVGLLALRLTLRELP
jgi:hypothetical protein